MLEKAKKSRMEGTSANTIRHHNSKIVTCSDIIQYNIKTPIHNKQEHLHLLSFSTLFPTGQHVEHHPRQS
uniref:Uncharacterized protein n=1 Tax=Amphimedon queenslandica TaxID=400682 RepID=A0A1X7UBN2_AMPQE